MGSAGGGGGGPRRGASCDRGRQWNRVAYRLRRRGFPGALRPSSGSQPVPAPTAPAFPGKNSHSRDHEDPGRWFRDGREIEIQGVAALGDEESADTLTVE